MRFKLPSLPRCPCPEVRVLDTAAQRPEDFSAESSAWPQRGAWSAPNVLQPGAWSGQTSAGKRPQGPLNTVVEEQAKVSIYRISFNFFLACSKISLYVLRLPSRRASPLPGAAPILGTGRPGYEPLPVAPVTPRNKILIFSLNETAEKTPLRFRTPSNSLKFIEIHWISFNFRSHLLQLCSLPHASARASSFCQFRAMHAIILMHLSMSCETLQ